MKLKLALASILLFSAAVFAGPSIQVSFGTGYQPQRPIICTQQPVFYQQQQYFRPVVFVNTAPVFNDTRQRFSNVSPVWNQCNAPAVYRVPAPVYATQPVILNAGSIFRAPR